MSAVIPVFNGETTIAETLESVFAQRFDRRFEVIVVNDGSTDGTRAMLEKYGERIRVIDQENRGISAARNAGIAAATGEYIALLDADDTWTEDKLEKTVPVLDENPGVRRGISGMTAMDKGDRGFARRCYRASIRHRPLWLKIYFRLGWAMLPTGVSQLLSPMLSPGLRRSLSGPPFLEQRTQ